MYQGEITANEEELNESYLAFDDSIASYIDTLKAANKYVAQAGQLSPQQTSVAANSMLFLPKVEIEEFRGDPTKYHSFIAVFEESVEKHSADSGFRLTRLMQYTEWKAKEAIRPCVVIGGKAGYDKARSILAKRFGDKHVISEAIIAKFRSGKSVHKKEDIQELTDQLNSTVVILSEMDKLHEIDTQNSIP